MDENDTAFLKILPCNRLVLVTHQSCKVSSIKKRIKNKTEKKE